MSRSKFESIVDQLVKRSIDPCIKCLKDAGITKAEIGEVLLVGGMTRMPKVSPGACDVFVRLLSLS